MGKEGKFQGKTTKDDIIEAVFKDKRHINCQRVPKKLPVLYSYTLFTLTFQYFYTDISAISVTFCNSVLAVRQRLPLRLSTDYQQINTTINYVVKGGKLQKILKSTQM